MCVVPDRRLSCSIFFGDVVKIQVPSVFSLIVLFCRQGKVNSILFFVVCPEEVTKV